MISDSIDILPGLPADSARFGADWGERTVQAYELPPIPTPKPEIPADDVPPIPTPKPAVPGPLMWPAAGSSSGLASVAVLAVAAGVAAWIMVR